MTNLSPAAQAVLHSFWDAPVSPTRNCQIAAALRVAADIVDDREATRQLNAIAYELEGAE